MSFRNFRACDWRRAAVTAANHRPGTSAAYLAPLPGMTELRNDVGVFYIPCVTIWHACYCYQLLLKIKSRTKCGIKICRNFSQHTIQNCGQPIFQAPPTSMRFSDTCEIDHDFTDVPLSTPDNGQIGAHNLILDSCSQLFCNILINTKHRKGYASEWSQGWYWHCWYIWV